uniref:Uncharacterized protein n=1 Tax=Cyclopterus lumpus TaxID=8103 RepID=A0A8C3AL90_CYCLU
MCRLHQVRETETWMPMRTTQTAAMSTRHDHPESSGDSPNGSDFGFTDAEDAKNDYDAEDDDDDEEEEDTDYYPTRFNDNKIPERPVPTDEVDLVQNRNEIPPLKKAEPVEEHPSNVLMSHASEDSIFNKTEVLAGPKKDEGSYDLGKKPIYKKAPHHRDLPADPL